MHRAQNHQHQRAAIADFLCPDNGMRGKQLRLGITPKDHMKENLRDLKHLQVKKREEKEDSARSQKDLYKLSQFRDVSSRVFDNIDNQETRTVEGEFTTKGMGEKRREELAQKKRLERLELEARTEESRQIYDQPMASPRKDAVPRSYETAKLAPKSNTNFISKNKFAVPEPRRGGNGRDEEELQDVTMMRNSKHNEFGRVPKYLEQRKSQWREEEEECRRRAPDPNAPKGMKLMPEEERMDTLDILQRNREEALKQLSKLPFVIETPSAVKKQIELESKLKEIEKAIALFSKQKVYIKI